jgi:hypothetical protein
MKAKTAADQFQLIPETDMPFNLTGETMPPEQPPPIPEHTNETTANLFLTEA